MSGPRVDADTLPRPSLAPPPPHVACLVGGPALSQGPGRRLVEAPAPCGGGSGGDWGGGHKDPGALGSLQRHWVCFTALKG